MDSIKIKSFVDQFWDDEIVPVLSEYIKIPSVSMSYDKDWQKNGYIHNALELVINWAKGLELGDFKAEILEIEGCSPLLYIDIPCFGECENDKSVMFTGHLDKMPVDPSKWSEGLHPWQPVLKDDKLYGRGGADDGYATFSYFAAIKAMHEQNIPHGRLIFFIETAEESGSPGFDKYLAKYKDRLGEIGLVVNFDSSCDDYDHLWCSYSTRGLAEGVLSVKTLDTTKHSGLATGIVPTPMMVVHQLLSRIEDSKTGKLLVDEAYVPISETVQEKVDQLAETLGEKVYSDLSLAKNVKPLSGDLSELIMNNSWRPTLCITGIGGLPTIEGAYSAIHPEIKVALSTRLPPGCDPMKVNKSIKKIFEDNPPFNAQVKYEYPDDAFPGWAQSANATWFEEALNDAAQSYFKNPCLYKFIGGSIGIFSLLQKEYPDAPIFSAGLLGFQANEHGPDEMLYIPMAKKLTACLTEVLAEYAHGNKI